MKEAVAIINALLQELAKKGETSGNPYVIEAEDFLERLEREEISSSNVEALVNGIDHAVKVVALWESKQLATAVQELYAWACTMKESNAARQVFTYPLGNLLEGGVVQAETVAQNWPTSLLADSVNQLEGWKDEAIGALAKCGRLANQPIVVVEMSGGVVQDVLAFGNVDVLTIDYDEDEVENPAEAVEIPDREDMAMICRYQFIGSCDPWPFKVLQASINKTEK